MLPTQSIAKLAAENKKSVRKGAQNSRFTSEKALVRLAISQSSWIPSSEDRITGAVTELETPASIVDIAYYQLRRDWLSHAVVGEIPSRWAYAFHKIPYRRRFTVDEFATLAGTSSRRAKLALLDFSDLALCRRSANHDAWLKVRQPIIPLRRLVSVEAKLRDWRKALDQAARFLSYSDQGWVLLDAECVKPALSAIYEFKDRNVGLASISVKGTVIKHFIPRRPNIHREHDRWVVASEMLKRITDPTRDSSSSGD